MESIICRDFLKVRAPTFAACLLSFPGRRVIPLPVLKLACAGRRARATGTSAGTATRTTASWQRTRWVSSRGRHPCQILKKWLLQPRVERRRKSRP